MKKKMTLALAASMVVLILAAAPHRALAASECYVNLDDGSNCGTRTAPPEHGVIVNIILTILGL